MRAALALLVLAAAALPAQAAGPVVLAAGLVEYRFTGFANQACSGSAEIVFAVDTLQGSGALSATMPACVVDAGPGMPPSYAATFMPGDCSGTPDGPVVCAFDHGPTDHAWAAFEADGGFQVVARQGPNTLQATGWLPRY